MDILYWTRFPTIANYYHWSRGVSGPFDATTFDEHGDAHTWWPVGDDIIDVPLPFGPVPPAIAGPECPPDWALFDERDDCVGCWPCF